MQITNGHRCLVLLAMGMLVSCEQGSSFSDALPGMLSEGAVNATKKVTSIDDWAAKAQATERAVYPEHQSVVMQRHPDFGWPWQHDADAYEVEVIGIVGKHVVSTQQNFLSWPHALKPGAYQWRVTAVRSGSNRTWSAYRAFTVPPAANAIHVPPIEK